MRSSKALVAAIVLVVVVMFGSFVLSEQQQERPTDGFVILHTNDTHCYYGDDGSLGFSTVKELKEKYISEGKTVFLVDAGDFLQGNSYGTLTEGAASVQVMNEVGYDLGTPGNHEFDFTFPVMMERIGELDYPIICANLAYESTGKSVFPEYKIIERDGWKIGFFGILTPDTPSTTNHGNMGDSVVTDIMDATERMVKLLKSKHVDYIVALGHVGLKATSTVTSDEICAEIPGIDIFIDAHSHTEMDHGKVSDGSIELLPSDTVIASTGSYNKNVGVITVSPEGEIMADLYRGEAISDPTIDETVEEIHEQIDEILSGVVATSEVYLNGERQYVRTQETNLADLVADSMRAYSGTQVAVVNGGGVRTSLEAGDITLKNVYDVMPFQNDLVTMTVTGQTLYDLMEFSYSYYGLTFGGFIQVSGMTVTVDPSKEVNSRVQSIYVGEEPVQKDATYTLTTLDFIATGGDDNKTLINYEKQVVGDQAVAFVTYLDDLENITADKIQMGRLIEV